jgi:SIR2-like protein
MVLLGAGASLKSGIPLSEQLVEIAARWAYCRDHGLHPDDPNVVRSDWFQWLQERAWYRTDLGPADNYSAVVDELLQPRQARKDFFLRVIKPGVPASAGYQRLLKLVEEGFVDTILTTNFDTVFPDLCSTHQRPHHMDIVRTPADHTMLSTVPQYPQYVFLHGTVEHYTDQNSLREVQRLDESLVARLTPLLRDRPLVVIGYRGAEPSIMKHLLLDQVGGTSCFRQGIYWCSLANSVPNGLHPFLAELRTAIGTNLQLVPIEGFDQLLDQIAFFCERQPQGTRVPTRREDHATASSFPYDMRPLEKAALDDLDWVRLRTVLATYCKQMKISIPAKIQRSWLVDRLCQLDLAYQRDGQARPTVAGYLLFGQEPQIHIKGAMTRIKVEGQAERVLTGNLWSQLEAMTELVDDVNRPFRLKGTVSEVVYPFPKLALKELIVNSLVHRRYDGHQTLQFDVEPSFIRITNPGGLVDLVFARVNLQLQEQIEQGLRGLKGYRNPVLADLFYGAGAMDKKGSGLPDVQSEVTRNGGRVAFGPTHDNSTFRAVVYRRPENIDPQTRTATPVVNKTKYTTNLIEAVSLPDAIWIAKSKVASPGLIWRDLSPSTPPPFVCKRGGEIISFTNLSERSNPLHAYVEQRTASCKKVARWQADSTRRNDLVWLLNACLYRHFESRSLVVDRYRKRAYFSRTRAGPREMTYQASFRQATRTVTKSIISKTTQKVLYWEHEAIWFGFQLFGDTWALRLLPGYVFTTDGGVNLLHHSRVGALSTKRAARDYTLQVHNDLVFWTWVVTAGRESVSIPTGTETPVLLGGALSSCELAMPIAAEVRLEAEELGKRQDLEIAEIEDEIAEAREADLERAAEDDSNAHRRR